MRWLVTLALLAGCERADRDSSDRSDPHKRAPLPLDAAVVVVPAPRDAVTVAPPSEVRVSLTKDGTLYTNGAAVTLAELDGVLAAASARDSETRLVIAADQAARYADIVAVMDHAKQAGLKRVMMAVAQPPP